MFAFHTGLYSWTISLRFFIITLSARHWDHSLNSPFVFSLIFLVALSSTQVDAFTLVSQNQISTAFPSPRQHVHYSVDEKRRSQLKRNQSFLAR